jgi:Fe2+ transport system protein FeoA
MLNATDLVGQEKNEMMSQDTTPTMPRESTSLRSVIPLSDLRTGDTARVHQANLDVNVARFLRAVGLTNVSEFRLCKPGEPCIIQVRSTRIGLSRDVARNIFVVPIAAKGPRA